jgi:ClpP class serine protease
MFVADIAKGRKVPESVVRGDPEKDAKHFGGGRVYPAGQAVALGMADRVETLDAVIARLAKGRGRNTQSARRSLALL